MLKFFTKKKLAETLKQEYLRGAKATAEAFKQQETDIASQKARLLDDWATLNRAKAELENNKASLILDGIKDIFAQAKSELPPRWY